MPEIKRTATETIMNVMEEFGNSEPKEMIVIYINTEGDLCWSATTDSIVTRFGLVEACKQALISRFREL